MKRLSTILIVLLSLMLIAALCIACGTDKSGAATSQNAQNTAAGEESSTAQDDAQTGAPQTGSFETSRITTEQTGTMTGPLTGSTSAVTEPVTTLTETSPETGLITTAQETAPATEGHSDGTTAEPEVTTLQTTAAKPVTTAAPVTTTAAPLTTAKPQTTTSPSTTKPVTTAPVTEKPTPAKEDPVKGINADSFHNSFDTAQINASSISTSGFSAWNDGSASYLFDGSDGYFSLAETKMGGSVSGGKLTLRFRTAEKCRILAYSFITGNDSAKWTGRTPISWTLFGSNDGNVWNELDAVSDSAMSDLDREYFGYRIDQSAQGEYLYYKFEFTRTTGGSIQNFQLNECRMYVEKKEPAEGPEDPETEHKLENDPYANAGYELILRTISDCFSSSTGKLNTATDNTGNPYVWGAASFIEALAEAYRLYPDNAVIKNAYVSSLTTLLNKYKVTGATIRAPKATYYNITYYNAGQGGRGDYYYDDNAWVCVQLLIGYEQLGDETLLNAAKENLKFLWTGWDDVLGGGIYWDKSYTSKNACSNGPVAIAMLKAYQLTGTEEYLEHGKAIYSWMRSKLLDGDLYSDNVNTKNEFNYWKAAYNQATMIYAGAQLYEITNDQTYYDQTRKTVIATNNLMFRQSGGNVYMNGNPIFKAWCIGWLARGYVRFYEVDPRKDTTSMDLLEKVLDREMTTKNQKGYYDPYFLSGDWGGESKTDILQPSGVASTFLLAGYFDVYLRK